MFKTQVLKNAFFKKKHKTIYTDFFLQKVKKKFEKHFFIFCQNKTIFFCFLKSAWGTLVAQPFFVSQRT